MDFINKIGQRNCAKLLAIVAFCFCFINNIVNDLGFLKGVLSLSMYVFPNYILFLASNKNKDFRFFSLIFSFVLLLLNLILLGFNFKLALFLLLIVQCLGTLGFYIYIYIFEKNKQIEYRNKRKKISSDKHPQKTKDIETTTTVENEI